MSIKDEVPLIVGKMYCIKHRISKKQYPVGILYENPISLTDMVAWVQTSDYQFVCFAFSGIPFLLLEIGESSLVEINSEPPDSFNETWLKVLYENNIGWIKVDMFRLEEWEATNSQGKINT